jgi:excisionase family DNA binding protein
MIPLAEEKPLLTTDEVAEILNISRSSVYRMINTDLLPTVSVGGNRSWRIRTADLRKFAGLEA